MAHYKSLHFTIEELVSPKVFNAYKDSQHKLWQLFDPNLLDVLDRLQEKFGTTYVNTWKWGGIYTLRGLRHMVIDLAELKREKILLPVGPHEFGRAIDCHFKTIPARVVREYILSHKSEYPEITGIETNVNWLHFDTRNSPTLQLFPG